MPSKKHRGQDYTIVNGKDEKDDVSVQGVKLREIAFMPSTLETIDRALTKWLDETLNIFSTTHEGFEKVPIIWEGTERAFQIKENKDLRDDRGQLRLPLITLDRTSIEKDPNRPGAVPAHAYPMGSRGGTLETSRRIQQNKTNNFATADSARRRGSIDARNIGTTQLNFPRKNNKVVYETITIPLPVYVNVKYSVVLRAEYRQQINEMLTPFLVETGQITQFMIEYDGHTFEAFLPQDFEYNTNFSDMSEEERLIENKIEVRVLGYLIGAGKNEKRPRVSIRENAVQVRLPRERSIVQDEHPEKSKGRFYRE
tara:strand:- start:265 stop:1200 length:936 start_codon:yes stop_codon:yes gene_type:complete